MGHGNKFIIDYYKRRAQCASEEFVEWEESYMLRDSKILLCHYIKTRMQLYREMNRFFQV